MTTMSPLATPDVLGESIKYCREKHEWTDSEIGLLVERIHTGWPCERVAASLCRSANSCLQVARELKRGDRPYPEWVKVRLPSTPRSGSDAERAKLYGEIMALIQLTHTEVETSVRLAMASLAVSLLEGKINVAELSMLGLVAHEISAIHAMAQNIRAHRPPVGNPDTLPLSAGPGLLLGQGSSRELDGLAAPQE